MKISEMGIDAASKLRLDPFSALTMKYTKDGFNELVGDINKNGLLVPIILRDGFVLDGRHRLGACIQLGLDVRYTETGAISADRAIDIVISNSINKATGTDASKVEAYLLCKAKGLKQKEMPGLFSRLNMDYTRKLAFIEKENPEYLVSLLKQKYITLYNKQFNKVEDYGTINAIWRTLKGNKRLEGVVLEVTPEVCGKVYETVIDEVMVNYTAEQEYWDMYELGKMNGSGFHADSAFGKRIIALINHKYAGDTE
jgi:hypothetical protein